MPCADWREVGPFNTPACLFLYLFHYGKHRYTFVKITVRVSLIGPSAEKTCGLEMHTFDDFDILEHEVQYCACLRKVCVFQNGRHERDGQAGCAAIPYGRLFYFKQGLPAQGAVHIVADAVKLQEDRGKPRGFQPFCVRGVLGKPPAVGVQLHVFKALCLAQSYNLRQVVPYGGLSARKLDVEFAFLAEFYKAVEPPFNIGK